MISNQILQTSIDGIKSITKTDIWVLDEEGQEIAATRQSRDISHSDILSFAKSQADSQEIQGYQFFKVVDDGRLEYILAVSSEGPDAYMVGRMAVFQIESLLEAYKERFDNDSFIKNLILDNMLLVDI